MLMELQSRHWRSWGSCPEGGYQTLTPRLQPPEAAGRDADDGEVAVLS